MTDKQTVFKTALGTETQGLNRGGPPSSYFKPGNPGGRGRPRGVPNRVKTDLAQAEDRRRVVGSRLAVWNPFVQRLTRELRQDHDHSSAVLTVLQRGPTPERRRTRP
jgi:hypothetical protein